MLSIIVPIYNIEKYIEQCIVSIVAQTYDDLEIILVDDGSTDKSSEISNRYSEIDSRIKVIHKENGGLVSARKAGLDVATGDYVTYVDGDDWIDSDACVKMIRAISETDSDIVFFNHFENIGNSEKIVTNSIETGVYNKNELIKDIYPRMIVGNHFFEWQVFPSVWGFIIKRDLLVKSQFEVDDDISMGEDAACTYPCLLMANRVSFSEEAYYHYRQSSDSMIKQRQAAEIERRKFSKLYKSVEERLAELSYIYDVREQWKRYLLFMMLPRADHLFEGYEKLDYLFPYMDIKRGAKIAIYGAGTYGQRLYDYIGQTGFCDVVAWFDRNYLQLQDMGFDVINPDDIAEYDFDYVIVANMFYNGRQQIASFIKDRVSCKICEIQEEAIMTEQCLKGFGLI